jgi:hypothetical protein
MTIKNGEFRTMATIEPHRRQLLLLGFACGFAFNNWWWVSFWSGLVAANWIALTWEIGHAKLDRDANT